MHLLDQSLALERLSESETKVSFGAETHPEFKNLIGPYGGWSVGILTRALLEAAEDGMELVSITTDFLAGLSVGPIRIDVERDGGGRNTQFWTARMTSADGTILGTRATAVLSRRRETLVWTEGTRPEAPEPEDCQRFTPPMPWTKTLEIRAAINQPFKEVGQPLASSAWVRIDPGRQLDPAALVTLADTPVPRLFFVLGKPSMIATVSMTVYLHATKEDFEASGEDYMLVEADGARGHRGFYDQHARMWSRDGRLLATTQQIVWFKATAELAAQTG